jgi:hypothetical protein
MTLIMLATLLLSRNRPKGLDDFGCDEEQSQLRGPLLE